MKSLNFATYNLKNARDLGGTPLEDGSVIRKGLLIRSCALGQATKEEIESLRNEYDPRFIIDLRAAKEAEKDPDPLHLLPGACYSNVPLAVDSAVGIVREGGLKEAFVMMKAMTEDPIGMMTSMYQDIIVSQRGRKALEQVFDTLIEANGSCVLWHCTAGKDRAGITTAIILLALGASRKRIYDDYLLTNAHMEPYLEKQRKQLRFAPRKVKQSLEIMNRADPLFLDAAFNAIDAHYGSANGYLDAIGINEERRQTLREIYTTPLP